MRVLPLIFSAALVLAGTSFIGASAAWAEDAAAAVAPAPVSLPAITVIPVAKTMLTDRVLASGLVGPVETVLVQPLIEGQAIDRINVEIGETVSAGQVLAVLSNSSLTLQKSQLTASRAAAEATIAQAEAQVIEAQTSAAEVVRVRDRTLALAQQGTTSRAAADTASANATSAKAQVTVAAQGLVAAQAQLTLVDAQIANIDLSLQRTAVKAPVSGEVVERNAMIGAIASGNGTPMFTLVRDGLLELNADVAEQDILRLAAGQTVLLHAVGLTAPLTGKVRLVEPTVDTDTRLGRVRITIDNSAQVRSGMFADAEILVSQKETLALPLSAIGGGSDGASALKVVNGVVSQTPVTTGIRDGGLIEITSGLAAGDLAVMKAGAFVRDGDHINPVQADTAAMSN